MLTGAIVPNEPDFAAGCSERICATGSSARSLERKVLHDAEQILKIRQASLAWRQELRADGIAANRLAERVANRPSVSNREVDTDRHSQNGGCGREFFWRCLELTANRAQLLQLAREADHAEADR